MVAPLGATGNRTAAIWRSSFPTQLCVMRRHQRKAERGSRPTREMCSNASFVLAAFALLTCASCNDSPEVIVINHHGDSVPAARDLEACQLMAAGQFEPTSDAIKAALTDALRLGRIVRLANGSTMQQQELLNYHDGRLIPWVPPGPMTVTEETRRHIGVYEWMSPRDGRYRGERLCVSLEMRFGKYPMP